MVGIHVGHMGFGVENLEQRGCVNGRSLWSFMIEIWLKLKRLLGKIGAPIGFLPHL